MQLSTRNVAHFLIERCLLDRDSLVNEKLVIADVSRRHRNLKVLRENAPGFFVKQTMHWDAQSIGFLKHEAACYWLAQNDRAFAPLAGLIPNFRGYDANSNALIVDLLPGAENLSEYHLRVRTFPLDVASMLGQALGRYHRHKIEPGNAVGTTFPKATPWILSFHEAKEFTAAAIGPANTHMLTILQRYPEFVELLTELRSQWRIDSLIHGDIKWDNCMLYESDGTRKIVIVDWELADQGDAAWDVGAVFQAYLLTWLGSMPDGSPASAQQLVESAGIQLETMQPAIGAFWNAYVTEARFDTSTERERLDRSLRYGAARLIQTAYEYLNNMPQLTAAVIRLLQVSFNILSNPDEARCDLLGLS
ncbi:phosphotransferase [Paraburkholderia acidiphila]|uniref:Phosphotransferase n=1 Tax=Paraburkholderia acidiphila TaxID=2571747 RepID=A0A7Z2JCN5_9BURK|nr:phosphotransferase [Paraburkholderia acidiphila]QGZ58629.1 phosphotransferase [Paraburkholderia acidiphila]